MAMIDILTRTALVPAPKRHSERRGLLALWTSRRALASLDASRLDDIGLSARDATKEAARPIWDVPHTWRD